MWNWNLFPWPSIKSPLISNKLLSLRWETFLIKNQNKTKQNPNFPLITCSLTLFTANVFISTSYLPLISQPTLMSSSTSTSTQTALSAVANDPSSIWQIQWTFFRSILLDVCRIWPCFLPPFLKTHFLEFLFCPALWLFLITLSPFLATRLGWVPFLWALPWPHLCHYITTLC